MSTEQLATGWYEFNTSSGLTSIAHIYESGDAFIPDHEFSEEDFANASRITPLVRAPRVLKFQHQVDETHVGAVLSDSLGEVWVKRAPSKWESTSGLTSLEPTLLPATVLREDAR
jgi:hypothetical protein